MQRLTLDDSAFVQVSRGKRMGKGRVPLQFRHFAIGLADIRGGIIGVYGDLWVKTLHRVRKSAAFGIIDGAFIWRYLPGFDYI